MSTRHVCACYVYNPRDGGRTFLPQVKLDAHTTILSTASRTVLTQTFVNHSKKSLPEIRYAFPLYDGVSVVDFCCQVGERTIYGLVKEKNQAKKTYKEAKERGENAAILEQLPAAADVFTTTISNIPAGASVQITVKYVQELQHDAAVDGLRLTIPTHIAPRYGAYPGALQVASETIDSKGMSITVDVSMAEGAPIKKIISPSHPIQVTLGSLSSSITDENQSLSRGSATLALGTAELERNFVLQVVAKDVGIPRAILETHPTLPNQRALMATLVPNFNLKPEKPEIILIADRSGSMQGPNIWTLKAALKVFLKSIPLGCTFNICSFGSRHDFLWDESQLYDEETLEEAIGHVERFEANFGGTETLAAVKACLKVRSTDSPTELILLTDGDIWDQDKFFKFVSQETKNGDTRIFPLGIGGGVSSALIEGVARAGGGFAQMVGHNEKMDSKIVRMLKGALTPHIKDYRLEIKYEDDSVDTIAESLRVHLAISDSDNHAKDKAQTQTKPISLYVPDAKEEHPKEGESEDIFAGLPDLQRPILLQTPHKIPALFPFHRTYVYMLMSPESSHLQPTSVVLKGTCPQGPLELEIPIESQEDADEMIHQLAARKATQELEEGHGWISDATLDDTGVLLRKKHGSMYALLQRREAVRLGVEFQVGGKYCSFVAVEANQAEIAKKRQLALQAIVDRETAVQDAEADEDWEVIRESKPMSSPRRGYQPPKSRLVAQGAGGQWRSRAVPSFFSAPSNTRSMAASKGTFAGFACIPSSKSPPDSPYHARRCSPSVTQTVSRVTEAACEVEAEESDDDMGCGLFDGDDVPAPHTKPESLLQRLIAQQSFSGPWPSLAALPCNDLGIDDAAAAQTAATHLIHRTPAVPDARTAEQLLATALVICFLEQKLPHEQDTWELVVEKARAWLLDALQQDDAALADVRRVAARLLGVSAT